MSDVVIRAENLGKKYQIKHQQQSQRYTALRDVLAERAKGIFRRSNESKANRSTEDFWALKDVSFEIKRGEVVGIIGRNGAGKSTLLKILSRITEPTEGRVSIKGRVASLLEVGTGFHPELTGRENIYLNGAILGMTRAEINRKFDEIVAFAEVEKFLDTPVKRYSSGMYVRLAFAVAAHLEPEILVIDEVLAVGDTEFQKKCLGKMSEVAHDGRTILFVSHNMAAIRALCHRATLLKAGSLIADGKKDIVIRQYLTAKDHYLDRSLKERTDRQGNGAVKLESISVESTDGSKLITCVSGLKIILRYSSTITFVKPKILIGIYDDKEVGIYGLDSEAAEGLPLALPSCGIVVCQTEPLNLTSGPCSLNVMLISGGDITDYIQNAISFDIEAVDFFGTGRAVSREWVAGLISHSWSLVEE